MNQTPLTHNALRLVGASVLVSMLGYSAVHAQTAPAQGASAADQGQAAKALGQNPLAGKSMESSKKGPGADKNQEQASKNPLPIKNGVDQRVQFQPDQAESKRQWAMAHIASRDQG